jgi:hypothetical protein
MEVTIELEPTIEDRATNNIDFYDLCEQLEALEEIVMVQRQHIQHVKLEFDEGEELQLSILQRRS